MTMSSGGTERRVSTGVLPREGKGAITLEVIDVWIWNQVRLGELFIYLASNCLAESF